MRYSKMFGKTVKKPKRDMTTASHKFLYQAGYIRESTAGRYYFLPLGIRVQQKIMALIKEEMDRSGAQELIAPVFHPLELWQETNRDNEAGFELTKVTDRRGAEFVPGGTAEEMMIDLVRNFQISYKDLPFNIYQFSSKFRDELRARGGLLRVREFIMKDAYSFHTDEKDFKKEYKNMWDTYTRIFNRVGLLTVTVESDNGYIGGEYCHEFVVEADAGESKFLMSEDGKYIAHEDVALFHREDVNSKDKEKPFVIIRQPKWVKTMEDNIKHYELSKKHFLKNVVYKNRVKNEIIIAVIRGDLEVNRAKLEHVLDAVGQLEDADEKDLQKIGTKPGYVHSWGHKARYIGDISLTTVKNFIGGQKEDKTDSINVNYGRDFTCECLEDIALAKDGYYTEDEKQKLHEKKGIEVGNIFQLGYHYSKKMKGASFTDKDGKEEPYYMGCYGIGIGRTMATVVEKHHDENGIIWPESVAPYQVHLIGLDLQNEEVEKKTLKVYEVLRKSGIEVLFDDREDIRAGEKFADADLIGIPSRVVVSKRTEDAIEVKKREEKKSQMMKLEEFITTATRS